MSCVKGEPMRENYVSMERLLCILEAQARIQSRPQMEGWRLFGKDGESGRLGDR